MILKNITKKTVLSDDLKEAKSFLDSLLGLLRKSNPSSLLFKTCFGIHTFFLKKPIDVVILDKYFKIVKLKENLGPNSLFLWNPKYELVLEFPAGTIKRSKSSLLDKLKLS